MTKPNCNKCGGPCADFWVTSTTIYGPRYTCSDCWSEEP